MRLLFVTLLVATLLPSLHSQQSAQKVSPVGRWQIRFTLTNSPEKNLVFTAKQSGVGSFQLLDTAPDNKPVPEPQPATWSIENGNLSISGEVELPVGTCCRQTGTLIFKTKLNKADSLSGKLIFVSNIDEEESPYQYHSTMGTFTASRMK